MKIVCEQSELVKAISIVQKAVPTRTTMPILECILLDADTGHILLTANDTELGIETHLKGEILEKGNVALNARLFSDIIRKLPEADVMITCDEQYRTRITCGKAMFEIGGLDGFDFVRLPYVERNERIVLSQYIFREMIRQTIFSIAQNETNRIMTGELMEMKDGYLRLISLDGHRISIRRVAMEENYTNFKAIVPGKTLNEIAKILSGENADMVHLYLTKDHLMMDLEETLLVSRLIEGNYFRVDQMISPDYETKVTLQRRELLDCIDRAVLLVREDDKKPLMLEIGDRLMGLSIRSQIGSLNESIPVMKEGKDLRIGFNPKFLMDALRVIDDEEVDLYFMNAKAPCVIRDREGNYLYLVLPVNFI